jgi:hypothetical protein
MPHRVTPCAADLATRAAQQQGQAFAQAQLGLKHPKLHAQIIDQNRARARQSKPVIDGQKD